jgi:site-specific DNA-methyltransferase (adenine-specific)
MNTQNRVFNNRYIRRNGGSYKLINNDFLKTDIQKESVQLVVTSPPYNLGIKYSDYNDSKPIKEYYDFMEEVMDKLYALLGDSGRLILNIPIYTSPGTQNPISVHFSNIVEKVGFSFKSAIVWCKQNASNRFAFGSYCSASSPAIVSTEELILVFYKKEWKRKQQGESTISKLEFMENSISPWKFSGETNQCLHPAPYPFELPYRSIQYFSFLGDTVLDPFMGRGTTVAAAASLGRHGIGTEISKDYCLYAEDFVKIHTQGLNLSQGN